jgi:phage-related minor tail protein
MLTLSDIMDRLAVIATNLEDIVKEVDKLFSELSKVEQKLSEES